jgi:lipopolysaccharide transport system ATP-binding protein
MSDIAIRVENISKRYHIGHSQKQYKTLRDSLTESFSAPVRRLSRLLSGDASGASDWGDTIWALKNVSFEIKRGEVVGIIGHNGSGKSTLLKLLSRITEPTGGNAEIHGRVGAMLEVGTGFHGELTGRENLYLNGAILGMRKTEIDRKLDEIIEFSGVEKFIDTPVKHYSSGMFLRLAFAVAAYLEPENLIVDEVLAVGDLNFQRKCLNKMEDVGREGRTVLFVSHNMAAITRLCSRAILLSQGQIVSDGPSHQIVDAYLNAGFGITSVKEWPDAEKAPGDQIARLRAVRVCSETGQVSGSFDIRDTVLLEMEFDVLEPGKTMFGHFQLFNSEGFHIFSSHEIDPAWRRRPRPTGRWISTVRVPGNFLSEGSMLVGVGLITLEPETSRFYQRDAVVFQVVDNGSGDSARGDWLGQMGGVIRPLLEWNTQMVPQLTEETVRR